MNTFSDKLVNIYFGIFHKLFVNFVTPADEMFTPQPYLVIT